MTTKVTLNHAWFRAFLKSPAARSVAHGGAEKVLAAAQGIAPVLTGAYRDSIHIESVTTDRAVERVVSDVPYAMVIEARDRVLTRAIDAI